MAVRNTYLLSYIPTYMSAFVYFWGELVESSMQRLFFCEPSSYGGENSDGREMHVTSHTNTAFYFSIMAGSKGGSMSGYEMKKLQPPSRTFNFHKSFISFGWGVLRSKSVKVRHSEKMEKILFFKGKLMERFCMHYVDNLQEKTDRKEMLWPYYNPVR